MADVLPQTHHEDHIDLLAQSENAVSHVVDSEATSALEQPRQLASPISGKKRNIVQQVDLNSTRELSDPITSGLKSPQNLKIETDENHLFDDLHAKIVQNLRESKVLEVKETEKTQPKTLPGPYIGDGLYVSNFSYSSYGGVQNTLRSPTTNGYYMTRSAASGVYARPMSMSVSMPASKETSPKGFGHLLVKINNTLRSSNPAKFGADDVKVSYRIPTEYTSNLSVRQNTEAWNEQKRADDQRRVDQILARIIRTSHKPASILRNSTQSIPAGPAYDNILTKSINQEVRFSVGSERESVKKAAKPQGRQGRTVTRGLQNDEDSMFIEKSPERIQEEEFEEIVYERREEKVVHKEEKPKKLTKRQEILANRKSERSSSQQLKSSDVEEMRKSRVTLNDKPLERNYGTEFILSPKRISATHFKSFGNSRGKGNSFLSGKVFDEKGI